MVNVVGGEFAAFAVLDPLFADLIAADVKFPDLLRCALNIQACRSWGALASDCESGNFFVYRPTHKL